LSRSEGLITVDGTDYSLPYSLTGSVIATPYTLVFFLDPCLTTDAFDHWESSANITIIDPSSDSTTFTLDSGVAGTITAVYKEDFQIDIDYVGYSGNPCNPAKITVDGVQYSCPDTIYEYFGDWVTLATVSSGDIQHEFDYWETTGGISVTDAYANPTTMNVIGNGTLIAHFRLITVGYYSIDKNNYLDTNRGEIFQYWDNGGTWELEDTFDALPELNFALYLGSYMQVQWDANGPNPATGKVFDHWEVTGNVVISGDPNSATTQITVNGSGTITAVYVDAP